MLKQLHKYSSYAIFLLTVHSAVGGTNLLYNGDFKEGLSGWHSDMVEASPLAVVPVSGGPAAQALSIDARRIAYGERTAVASAVPVVEGMTYRGSGWMKRLSGSGYRSRVGWVWYDDEGAVLGLENIWNDVLWGNEWEQTSWQAVAPHGAVSAAVTVGLEMGYGEKNAALFTDIVFEKMGAAEPALLADLYLERIGGPGEDVASVSLRLTNISGEPLQISSIKWELPKSIAWTVEPDTGLLLQVGTSKSIEGRLRLVASPDPEDIVKAVAEVEGLGSQSWQTPLNITWAEVSTRSFSELAAPNVPTMPFKLGAYYFPVMIDWGDGDRRPGVRALEPEVNRPLLGHYDESSPEVADWHIYWALQHGISWFSVDWYWNQGEEFLNEALDEGLMKSSLFDQIEFCINWCNQEPSGTNFRDYDYSLPTLLELLDTLSDRYFSRDNYLRVDGKPVLMIFLPTAIVNANGEPEDTKLILDRIREKARELGHPGLFLIAIHNTPGVPDYATAGFDALTSYSFLFGGVYPDIGDRVAFPFEKVVRDYKEYFGLLENKAKEMDIPYIPTAWSGWDDLARWGSERAAQSSYTPGNTPERVRGMLESLPEYVDPELNLALIEAWNEWGEGTTLEPDTKYGFGYLSAIRDVLSIDGRGPYETARPSEFDIDAMQAAPEVLTSTPYAKRYNKQRIWKNGLMIDFESRRSLSMKAGQNIAYAWIENGSQNAFTSGPKATLDSPEALFIEADAVSNFAMDVSMKKATQVILRWNTESNQKWDNNRQIVLRLKAGETQGELSADLSSLPEWVGTIYQFKIIFNKDPEEVQIGEIIFN